MVPVSPYSAIACIPGEFEKPGVALLSNKQKRAHPLETINDPLRRPAADAQRFGQMGRVKRRGQRAANQPGQVGGRPQAVLAADGDESLIFDFVVVFPPPPPPAMARVTRFLDLHQQTSSVRLL